MSFITFFCFQNEMCKCYNPRKLCCTIKSQWCIEIDKSFPRAAFASSFIINSSYRIFIIRYIEYSTETIRRWFSLIKCYSIAFNTCFSRARARSRRDRNYRGTTLISTIFIAHNYCGTILFVSKNGECVRSHHRVNSRIAIFNLCLRLIW